MTTLSDLETMVARDLRDASNNTWSSAELDDLINQGIDELASFYPKEIVQTIGTIAAGTYSYAASSFSRIYRIDIYSSSSSYKSSLPGYLGDSPNSGWEMHGGVIYLPPLVTFTAGDTLRAFGYGGYIQLSVSSSTTDLDTTGIHAVRVFARATAFSRLLASRAAYQQWLGNTENTDLNALALMQMARDARSEWDRERQRLRRMRKR